MKISEKIIIVSLLLINFPFLLFSFTNVSIESLDDYLFQPGSEP